MNPQESHFYKMINSELFTKYFPEIISFNTNFGKKEWNDEYDVEFEIFVPKSWYIQNLTHPNQMKEAGKIALYRRKITKRLDELARYVGISLPRFYPNITYIEDDGIMN